MAHAGHCRANRLGRTGRGGPCPAPRPRRRPLRGASRGVLLAVHPRSRQDFDRCRARSARGGRFPALLCVRGAAAVHAAAAAAGPDRRAERVAPAWPRRVRQHLAVEFPAGDLHRAGLGAAGCGQCRNRQARRADAAHRRARGRADAPGGHSQGRRPARARVGQGRRRNADRASAARRRRLHRLDRHRAHDQPHARGARRADHPVHRRNRRAECDDRRQFGAARAGHPRRHLLRLPEHGPTVLGLARAVRPGGRRRRDYHDDRGRDESAEGGRSKRPCDRRRAGHRRAGQAAARGARRMARQERQADLSPGAAEGGEARLLRSSSIL